MTPIKNIIQKGGEGGEKKSEYSSFLPESRLGVDTGNRRRGRDSDSGDSHDSGTPVTSLALMSKRKRGSDRGPEILPAEVYSAGLKRAVEGTYFPSLPQLRLKTERADAVRQGDELKVRGIDLALEQHLMRERRKRYGLEEVGVESGLESDLESDPFTIAMRRSKRSRRLGVSHYLQAHANESHVEHADIHHVERGGGGGGKEKALDAPISQGDLAPLATLGANTLSRDEEKALLLTASQSSGAAATGSTSRQPVVLPHNTRFDHDPDALSRLLDEHQDVKSVGEGEGEGDRVRRAPSVVSGYRLPPRSKRELTERKVQAEFMDRREARRSKSRSRSRALTAYRAASAARMGFLSPSLRASLHPT